MTGFTNTPFGKAWEKLLEVFGYSAAEAADKVNTEAAAIKVDIENAFKPVVREIETLAPALFKQVLSNGLTAAQKAEENKEDVLDAVLNSVEDTVAVGAKADAPLLSAETVTALGSLILSHVNQAKAAANG